jgi:hypothetical protein
MYKYDPVYKMLKAKFNELEDIKETCNETNDKDNYNKISEVIVKLKKAIIYRKNKIEKYNEELFVNNKKENRYGQYIGDKIKETNDIINFIYELE